jgi:hypothetical protein
LGIKRPGRETDHSHPSSAEVKERVELYLHSPNTPSWRGAQLQHRDNFAFFTYGVDMNTAIAPDTSGALIGKSHTVIMTP